MNEKFKTCLQDASESEIPALLDILKSHFDKIPSHLRGTFNGLKQEFYNQPIGFYLDGWKAKLLVLIGDFGFEITEKEVSNKDFMTKEKNNKDFINQAHDYLEDGEIGEALKMIIQNTRGTKIHPIVIAINVSYKEYEKDKLAGKNVSGQLQDITTRVTELLEKL